MQATDEQLVARCRQGDAAAFDSLVERYQRKVLGLCLRHLRSYEEACDLAQEVFVQVFKHLPDFEGRSSFSTWLYRVSLNACYNRGRYFKAKGRGSVTSLDSMLERKEGGADSSGLLRDKATGPLEALQLSEDLAQLRQAMDALDDDHRKVVDLVDIEELSYDEAAKVLDLPLNTVRSRLSRARQQLKVKLTRVRKRLGEKD
jgi:RNA polymerase sigma-70 factor (ECF subfamily)